jgi:hypothetical protein
VDNNIDKKMPQNYYPRFAATAVLMGFVTAEQVKEALTEQLEDNILNKPHRQLGQILLTRNWITSEQIDIVLHDMHSSCDMKHA